VVETVNAGASAGAPAPIEADIVPPVSREFRKFERDWAAYLAIKERDKHKTQLERAVAESWALRQIELGRVAR
jgi:hypothetical protein